MSQPRRTSRLRATALLGAGTLITAAALAGLAPGTASASSHREAPGILGEPAVRQHRPVRLQQPGQGELGDHHRELERVRRAGRRPELLPVGDGRALRHQHRQQRRRQARHHLPLEVQELPFAQGVRLVQRERHVPDEQRAGHLSHRPEPARPPDLRPDAHQRQPPQEDLQGARQRAPGAVVRRRRVDA